MIEALKVFANDYRAVDIQKTRGMEGNGWVATIMKDGRVLGEAADYADGASVVYNFETEEEQAMLIYCKGLYADLPFMHDEAFLSDLVNYELAITDLKKKAKRRLMKANESDLDKHGIANTFETWSLADSPEAREAILKHDPTVKFLNDELAQWEAIKKPRKK